MRVRELMTPYPHTVLRDAPLRDAVALMQEHQIHEIPVSDGIGIEGILTDRDVRMILGMAADLPWDRIDHPDLAKPVARFMTRELTLVAPDTRVSTAARLLAELGVRSLPVVDDDELVGILSVTDVLIAAGPLFDDDAA
jgi:acetoin utilization protein AcuB